MINEIAMALMFAALFILVVLAVVVGGRMGREKPVSAPEIDEEPPKETIEEEQEPQLEERPPTEIEQYSAYMGVEEPSLEVPEPDFFSPEQPVEMHEPDAAEETVEFSEPVVELSEPGVESAQEIEEVEQEAYTPGAIALEPVLLETQPAEEPVAVETFEDTYREPDYFRDEDVSPVQGVTTCPHCGEKVPATLYCINCGKSLNE